MVKTVPVVLLLLSTSFATAAMRPVSDQEKTPEVSRSEHRTPFSLDFYVGSSFFKEEPGVALGIRYPWRGPWAFEMGGILPNDVSDYADDDSTDNSIPPFSIANQSHVLGFGEMHILGLYTLASSSKFHEKGQTLALDVGVGLSLGFITNENRQVSTHTGTGDTQVITPKSHVVSPAPRVQLGLRYAPAQRLTLRLDLAYMYYGNSDTISYHNADLSFGGVLIQPAVGWTF